MRDPDVGNDCGVGRGDACQRSDLARMIHPELPNRKLIVAICFQHGTGQTDVIVEIALRFRHPEDTPQNRGCKILGGGFTVAAGDAEHF